MKTSSPTRVNPGPTHPVPPDHRPRPLPISQPFGGGGTPAFGAQQPQSSVSTHSRESSLISPCHLFIPRRVEICELTVAPSHRSPHRSPSARSPRAADSARSPRRREDSARPRPAASARPWRRPRAEGSERPRAEGSEPRHPAVSARPRRRPRAEDSARPRSPRPAGSARPRREEEGSVRPRRWRAAR